jgi:hypothetical protein
MLENDNSDNILLHACLCVFLILVIQWVLVWQIRRGMVRIKAIRQALVNLPYTMLLDPKIINQLKRLEYE